MLFACVKCMKRMIFYEKAASTFLKALPNLSLKT